MLVTVKREMSAPGKNRCAVFVGKSVAKQAVERNRIKRQLRAILAPVLKKQKTLFIKVMVKPGIQTLPFEHMKAEALRAFREIV